MGSSIWQWRPVFSWSPGTEGGAVVLGDVEIQGPVAERVGDLVIGGIERGLVRLVEILGQDAVLFGVGAEDEQHRVRHVGLVADDAAAC